MPVLKAIHFPPKLKIVNTRVGAWLYNFSHHQGVAIVIGLVGLLTASRELQLAGLVLFSYSAMDRAFGYGLKYSDDFKPTHLGRIGKADGA